MSIHKYLVVAILLGIISFLGYRYYEKQEQEFFESRETTSQEIRDYERLTHVNVIAEAIRLYFLEHKRLPADITRDAVFICSSIKNIDCADDQLDLSILLKGYLALIPSDPQSGFDNNTFYQVLLDGDVVNVIATKSEIEEISASRSLNSDDGA